MSLDKDKLNDPEYLKSLMKSSVDNLMGFEEYFQQEEEDSDMFLFLKYVTPLTFKHHVSPNSEVSTNEKVHTISKALENKDKTGDKQGFISLIR